LLAVSSLKAQTDLLSTVEGDLGPARRHNGVWHNFVCPFHADGDQDGGSLKINDSSGRWWCFACGKGGDVVDWVRERQGVTFAEACRQLGAAPSSPSSRTSSIRSAVAAVPRIAPSLEWQQAAEEVVQRARQFIWTLAGCNARAYLMGRGLTEETIQAWDLGYNPSNYRTSKMLDRQGQPVAVPRGWVIPLRERQTLWGVKVRLPDGTPGDKYVQLTGSRPALFGEHTLRLPVSVLCEGEFDAMLLHQEAGDLVGVGTTTGGAKVWVREWNVPLLFSKSILVAYDNDEPGDEGAAAVMAHMPRARRVKVPTGKDVTEHYLSGGNLREWIEGELAIA
jgi:DNA primase